VLFVVIGMLSPPAKCFVSSEPLGNTIGLTELGYAKPKYSLFAGVQIRFLSNSQLAISFPTRNPNWGLSRRSQHDKAAFLFKTVIIDPQTGRMSASQLWGNFKPLKKLIPLPAHQLLLQDDGELELYSDDFHFIAKASFPSDRFVTIVVSFDGMRIYIVGDPEANGVTVLDSHTLSEIGQFEISTPIYYPVASATAFLYQPNAESSYIFVEVSKKMQRVITPTPPLHCGGPLTFINDSRLVVSGDCHSLAVMEQDGTVLKQLSLGNRSPGKVFPVSKGNRFCAETFRVVGGSKFFDIDSHMEDLKLVCFNSESGQQLYSVPIPSQKGTVPLLAVSPDASRLAFVDGGKVAIVDLPVE